MTTDAVNVTVRPATEADVPLILGYIRELAEYERLLHQVTATEELLRESLFGPRPSAEVLLAGVAGEPAGYALFFRSYSTFLAREGLYLEDVYVRPHLRGRGVGRTLLARVAAIAVSRGCGRLEWAVLDWNEPSIAFYRSLGAHPMGDWTTFRLTGEALQGLGRGGDVR